MKEDSHHRRIIFLHPPSSSFILLIPSRPSCVGLMGTIVPTRVDSTLVRPS